MSNGYWIPKEASGPHDGDMGYDDSPRVEAKRSHQWFMDGPEANLFPNKKQAVEDPNNNNSFLGMLTSNSSPWSLAAGVQPLTGHFDDQLYDSEASRAVNFEEKSIPSMASENFNLERKMLVENPFVNDSSFALSISCASEDLRSGLNYGGVRKVKVSEVKDRDPIVPPVTSGQLYSMMENNAIFTSPALGNSNETPMSLSCPSTLVEENNTPLGNNGDRRDNFFMSMEKPNDTENKNTLMGHSYDNGIWKDENSIMGIGQSYSADDCSISMNHMYSRGNSDSLTMSNSYNMVTGNIGQSFGKGQSTLISFGGYDEDTNTSGGLDYNYELLMAQHAAQTSNALSEIDLVNPNSDAYTNVSSQINLSGIDVTSKKKEEQNGSKKASSNSFPTNVRSLLSTGILDGILVKYIAWSKEKELRAFIRGTGYLCGCQSCNYTKVINAYEFERHAGCKTKHPNNHIYFENGKTIYGIVQELRSTPQNILFDVMQTITGSPINQKSFRLWKESYLAATRELQRIYGKEDGRQLS